MKKILLGLLAVVAVIVGVILVFFKNDAKNPYEKTVWGKFGNATEECSITHGDNFAKCDYSVPSEDIPTFKSVDFKSTNVFDNKKNLPWLRSSMIDIDNDGIDEVFIAGGVTQEDALWKYVDGNFKNISTEVGLSLIHI